MKPVFFDHNSTTPLDEEVLESMLPYLREEYGNASSRHEYGTTARNAVNRAREQIAEALGAQASQLVFVSGGTEANNMFIKGAAAFRKPSQVIVSAIEHPCIMKPAQDLARAGWNFRSLLVDAFGRVGISDLDNALKEPTGLVSVMLANNETGVIQDIATIATKARNAGAWVHTDSVQAFGKIAVDFASLNVHAMTLSSHKIYGPKGAGALIVDKRIDLKPIIQGGGHEKGLRSGTENVPAIVGFGAAAELAVTRMHDVSRRLGLMRDRLDAGLIALGATIFGVEVPRLPNTSYFAFAAIDGETLVIHLDKAGYAVSSGSACSSTSTEPSATLLAMDISPEIARGAARVSLGKDNRMEQIEDFLVVLKNIIEELRHLTAMAV